MSGSTLTPYMNNTSSDPTIKIYKAPSNRIYDQDPQSLARSVEAVHKPISEQYTGNELFNDGITQCYKLWAELAIPVKDTNLFVESYCKEFTPFNWYVIQHQLNLLKQHKISTKTIVKQIARRGKMYVEIVETIPTFQSSDNDGKRGKFLDLLEKYRYATLELIENIVTWREQLWRPLPFYYKNKNYLFTLIQESEAFRSPAAKKLWRKLHTAFLNYEILIPKIQSRYMGIPADMLVRYESGVKVLEVEGQLQEYLRKESLVNARDGVYLPILKWKPYCHPENDASMMENRVPSLNSSMSSPIRSPGQKIELVKLEKYLEPEKARYYITVYEVIEAPERHSLLLQAYSALDSRILKYNQPLDLTPETSFKDSNERDAFVNQLVNGLYILDRDGSVQLASHYP